nr:hypothetical protein [Rickettsia endosymbiont of Ceutorhynchus assimilis]
MSSGIGDLSFRYCNTGNEVTFFVYGRETVEVKNLLTSTPSLYQSPLIDRQIVKTINN